MNCVLCVVRCNVKVGKRVCVCRLSSSNPCVDEVER